LNEAIEQYELGLRQNPDDLAARNNLGSALLQTGRTAEAVREFEQVVRSQPNASKAHLNLGLALLQTGTQADACREFQETLRLDVAIRLPESARQASQRYQGETSDRK
jgi:Flp pilus assembly protein TadD